MGRRAYVASAVAVLTLLVTSVAGSADTSTSTSVTTSTMASVSGPAPICVPGATRRCSAWGRRDTWAGVNAVYTAQFAPDPRQPSVKAYAAWLRTSVTDLALYPGYKGPGATPLPRGPMMVPLSARSRLLATFNSGFYESDGAAGFYVNHLLYFPMLPGLATVVRYRDGSEDVVAWRGGARPPANVLMARQNLPLLVDHGAPTARTANNALWGLTLHGVPAVWRTALGVTAQGDLVYLAAPAQTAATLARAMVLVHCVRAMELDINPEWPIFVTYAARGAAGPSLYVPNPNQIPGRFLYPSTKDFFAVYLSGRRGAPQPW